MVSCHTKFYEVREVLQPYMYVHTHQVLTLYISIELSKFIVVIIILIMLILLFQLLCVVANIALHEVFFINR